MMSDTMITRSEAADRVKATAERFWDELGDPDWKIVLATAKIMCRYFDMAVPIVALAWSIVEESKAAGSVLAAMGALHQRWHAESMSDVPEAIALRGNRDGGVWRCACLLVAGHLLMFGGLNIGGLEMNLCSKEIKR